MSNIQVIKKYCTCQLNHTANFNIIHSFIKNSVPIQNRVTVWRLMLRSKQNDLMTVILTFPKKNHPVNHR